MSARMTGTLIGLNAIAVVAVLAWIGWRLLAAFGRAMGSTSSSGNTEYIGFTLAIVGLSTLACVVYSFFAPKNYAKLVALAPLALIVLGQLYIGYRESGSFRQSVKDLVPASGSEDGSLKKVKFSRLSQDYVLPESECKRYRVKRSYLTHDKDLKTIVRIDVGEEGNCDAFAVGMIKGEELEVRINEKYFERLILKYIDKEGKSLADRYKISFNVKQWEGYSCLDRYVC